MELGRHTACGWILIAVGFDAFAVYGGQANRSDEQDGKYEVTRQSSARGSFVSDSVGDSACATSTKVGFATRSRHHTWDVPVNAVSS